MRLIIKLFVCLTLFSSNALYSFDLGVLLGDFRRDRTVGLLLSDVEHRVKQLEDLKGEREAFKKRSDDAIKTITNTITEIGAQIGTNEKEMKGASGSHEELLKKKLGLLNDRKQNLSAVKDLWKEVDGKIVEHMKLIENIVEALRVDVQGKNGKIIYSWKDLDEAKGRIDQLAGKIVTQNAQKGRFKKLKLAEKEEIAALKKDIESKDTEKEKISKELEGLSEKEEGVAFISELKAKAEVIEQETELLREKIKTSRFKIENLSLDERYKDDEVFLLKHKLRKSSEELERIQKKLVIDISDVEFAKGELEKAKKIAAGAVRDISIKRGRLKIRRDALNNKIKLLEKKLEEIKKTGELKTVKGYLIESRLLVVNSEKDSVDKELDFWDTKKERSDVNIRFKELKAKIIEILHTLGVSRDKVDEWLDELRIKLRTVEHARKVLRDKRDEITNFISSINKKREDLLAKQKEIKEQQEVKRLFERAGKEYVEIRNNIERSLSVLSTQKWVVERHLSQIFGFLVRQEDVINQYNFIVKYLESQKTEGLWKRSSRAISLGQLGKALFEIEDLFKGLFWDTPEYLSPVALFQTVEGFAFDNYLGIALFALLFILLFLIARLLLVVIHRHLKGWLKYIIGFVQEHLFIILLWKFFQLHIFLGLTYFRPLASSYGITIFYLSTIPVMIYLSRSFVLRLREINQKLNFLLISESMQWKATLLFEIFLYATSVILPLRKAFLVYFDRVVAFSEVSLAAYTLILVVIILFFFNKDDILRFLSGRNWFVVLLSKKVDRYYYPVFTFFMFLLILSNPYIGYSNLAWYLAFAVPATIFIFYGIFLLHYIIRRYSLFFFIKEEDDEVINKFEHAKAYYGLFIALTFVALALGVLVLIARLWGIEGYTIGSLWTTLSEDWVIRTGPGIKDKLGFVELGKLGMFITSGLVISSFIKKFLLVKVFDIFRTEPGVQNTVSRIMHYFVIILALILGFTAINLSQYALTVGGLFFIGVGFGLRDQIADYFAGILVLLERPIEIGHYVESGEYQGKVHNISARSTTLKTARNFFITIPNRDLIAKPIVNWGQGRYAVGCEIKVTVSFDSDPELVKKLLLEVMKAHSMVLRVPAPLVRFEGFEASALYFYCRCYVSSRRVLDMWDLASDIRFAVMKSFKDNEIVIPYPQTVVHFARKHSAGAEVPEGAVAQEKGPITIKFDDKG